MPSQRAPWWMYIVAAAFIGYAALVPYQIIWGPSRSVGFEAAFRGGMVVLSVAPDSPGDRGGLLSGDRVVSVNGQVIRNVHDWVAIRANAEAGHPQEWEVLRGGERKQLKLTFERNSRSEVLSFFRGESLYFCLGLTSVVLALLIAFTRPHDPIARVGAWLIASGAISLGLPDGWAATWRHLPGMLGVLLWIPHLSRFVVDGVLLTFFCIFPRRLFRTRWPWVLLWAPVLLTLPWRLPAAYRVIYHPGNTTGAPEWVFTAGFLRTIAYLAATLVVLAVNYRRLEDVNQRRRVRVLVAGTGTSVLAVIAFVLIGSLGPATRLASNVSAVSILLTLAFPLSFAYAILRHRLLDIRVMVRQGLRYAMARDVLLSIVPAMGAFLVVDLLVHGNQPMVAVLEDRGWVYGVLGALALVARARQHHWLEALDRHFFRERYDAQRLLREIVEEVRQAGSLDRVAPRVVARIEAALHPEFAAILVRQPKEGGFRALASAPAGHAPPPLPSESKLVALVRVLGKPLEVPHSESGWLQQQLPHEETEFLRRARLDLVVPIVVGAERVEAFLALGVKRSEEPYSREDQDLLVAISDSLALLVERPQVTPPSEKLVFEECPKCGACYDTGAGRCSQEGATLVSTHLPRTLAGRYRLEKRRGRGGMGTVYEATDTALERRVAVKVIREDLVISPEAADRFRQEARIAASFTHPNVVTVYDFGVVAETRAFLVMELLEGATLREALQRQKRLAAGRVVEVLRGVCAAVEAAHRRQLIHRDLKPENVFLAQTDAGGVSKVLDFGIAKFLPAACEATADTDPGSLVGTLYYMSPEQLLGQPVDTGSDVWALAVVAYEMIAGAKPFQASTAGEWQAAVAGGRIVPLETHLSDPPPRAEEFFARALSPDRTKRPTGAGEFFTLLERALA